MVVDFVSFCLLFSECYFLEQYYFMKMLFVLFMLLTFLCLIFFLSQYMMILYIVIIDDMICICTVDNAAEVASTTGASSSTVTPHPTKPIVLSPNGLSSAASASSASLKWTVGMQQGIYLYLYTLLNNVSNMQEDLKRLAHTAIDVNTFPSQGGFAGTNSTTINIGASNAGNGTNAAAAALNGVNNMNNNITLPLSVHPRPHAQPVLIRTWQQLQHQTSALTASTSSNAANSTNSTMNKFASSSAMGMNSARYLELRQLFQQVHLVQLPLYSMLTAIFIRCEQMTAFDREVLALAVENWVLWLQPWKYKKGFLPGNDDSLYFILFIVEFL